ncbi:hypothetical protein Ndes2526A_g07854 [Nannochloris sp. 'desiccata']|nr:hypothetical protein KSW81_002603 [Chlorella desiccata (nom. nud.)]
MPGIAATILPSADAAPLKAEFSTDPFRYLDRVKNKLLIDGEWVDSVPGETFDVIDPRTEQKILEVASANAEDVDRAVKAARKAFDEGPWPKMGGAARGRILLKLADLIDANADELAALEALDNGKPYSVARAADIPLSAQHIRYYAGWADKIMGETIPVDDWFGEKLFAYTLHEPIGVVGQIVPWNFATLMAAWKIAPALACGNTVVLKPAEQTPMTALRLGELALEAGIPPGVLNIITGYGPSAGAPIVEHALVDKVAFTGSTEVGQIIMKTAANHGLKDVTLELGGKSPLIVWKDADIDEAVKLAHNGLFFNKAECCAAASRLFVHSDIYDEFVSKSAELAMQRKVGDPFSDDTEQGPQVDSDQFKKILGYIESGKEQGARLVAGGRRMGDKGYFIEPTVFADVADDMKIAKEEIFGPVMSILKYDTIEEVITRANNTTYGLASGIVAKDINVINRLSRAIKAGTVWCNCYNVYDHAVPFGGYKMSGIGRDKGKDALKHYCAVKAVYHKLDNEQAWM